MANKLLLTTTAGVAVATLTVLGCSAATASAKPAASAAHMTAYSPNDGPTAQVVVTGAVGDYGQAVSVNPDGSVNPEHNSQLELELQHGTFRLDIASIDKAFVKEMGAHFPSDPATCSGNIAVTQQVPVVKGSGTGAYQGVTGSFTLTISLDEVDKPTAGQPCNGTQAFLDQAILFTGPGALKL